MQTLVDQKPVVVVGSINADLVARVTRIPRPGETLLGAHFETIPGGKGANQAVAVGRLGYPVAMIGKLGSDAFAPVLRKSLEDAGVDTEAVENVEGASGVALIEVSDRGENSIVVVPGANAALLPADLDRHRSLIAAAGMVLARLEIPIESILRLAEICREESVPLMLDPAPARELPPELLDAVSWFTPNETEAAFFTGLPAEEPAEMQRAVLFAKGIKGLVLKQGSRGATLAQKDGASVALPPFKVDAVDTTAAGDAFNGAFATALMLGQKPADAARFAVAASAISVTRPGAQPSMASMTDVMELLGSAAQSLCIQAR